MNADKFTVEIELGNAAMQTYSDVASALQEVATKLAVGFAHGGDRSLPSSGAEGKIYDANGNVVGKWRTK
jgi:hypothetical protein